MKTPPSRRPAGFTLIELLVVIAIIVVLAAAGFAAGNAAYKSAQRTASIATAKSLEAAVNRFQEEYGHLPDVGDKVKTDTGNGVKLLDILLGVEGNGTNAQNKKSLRLLEVTETKSKSKGLRYRSGGRRTAEGLYDSFGNPFTVEMDVNFEERLRLTLGDKTEELNNRKVAVYSPGSDKKLGTDDDVITWSR